MPHRTARLVAALLAGLALAGPAATAQENDTDPDINVDVGDDEEGEEAQGAWWQDSATVLILVVLGVVIVGLLVALASRR